jgi:predicted acetyltransferase
VELVIPSVEHVESYVDALRRGWSFFPKVEPDDILRDRAAFVARLRNPEGIGPPVITPSGTAVPRLPDLKWWMWDGEFAGVISLRWQHGTAELPPTCLGHIGYSVVPWKQRRGYATRALGLVLPHAAALGLPYVEITTNADNRASQRVILANGGVFVERFEKSAENLGGEACRFRIDLHSQAKASPT